MIGMRFAVCTLLCLPLLYSQATAPVMAQSAPPLAPKGNNVSQQAALASQNLSQSVVALQEAKSGRDQVVALTQTIRAFEEGLAALREALRQAQSRENTLKRRFQSKHNEIALLLAVMARMERNAEPLLLLHPEGPVSMARSGMLLSEITPSLQAQATALRAELQELADLRALQDSAGSILSESLFAAQTARTQLSQAISQRRDLPKRYIEDPHVMINLLESADTLDAFAAGLAHNALDEPEAQNFISAMGQLPLPAIGRVIRKPDEADAAGVRRPGISLATRAGALVTSPWPATIRYLGPLLDYGNVVIIEPGNGYLMILSGMEQVFGEPGGVITAGEPLGLMGGITADHENDLSSVSAAALSGAGIQDTETLYLELRLGAAPVDPTEWFAATATLGE